MEYDKPNRSIWSGRLLSLAAVVVAAAAVASTVQAQTMSERDLIEALQGKGSRSAAPAPSGGAARAPKQYLDALQGKGTRAFSAKERTEIAAATSEKPSADLTVYFEFNSADITSQARPTLMTLGRALTSPELRESQFMIAGHTDAKGKAPYNQSLSERRAQSVREFLIKEFQLEPRKLVSVGYGKERLKFPAKPYAGENRRVQIVNLAE